MTTCLRARWVMTFLACVTVTTGCSPKSHSETLSEPIFGPVETSDGFNVSVQSLMDRSGVPGLSLAVIEDGRLVRAQKYGVSNAETGETLTDDHVFQAASLSKPVLAYIAMRLVDQGLLTLDQPLADIIENERLADRDYARELTSRLILSHQSGLPNWGGTPLEFNHEPGTRFGYSGEAYVYLQNVLSELTGLSLEALAQREVFGPLDMQKTHFSVSDASDVVLVYGHNAVGVPSPLDPIENNAASSLHTDAHDYARFMMAVMSGEGLSDASHETMMTRQLWAPADSAFDNDGLPLSTSIGWALGWGTYEADRDWLWHWGDNGDFRAFVALDPDKGDSVVYFANSHLGHTLANDLLALMEFNSIPLFSWLEYKQHDAPGFQTWRKGKIAEWKKNYPEMLKLFRQSSRDVDGSDTGLEKMVEWYEAELDFLMADNQTVTAQEAAIYVGDYGVRDVSFDGGYLFYQRDNGAKRRLIPAGQHRFLLEGATEFHFMFDVDLPGPALAIEGHYAGGRTDRDDRMAQP